MLNRLFSENNSSVIFYSLSAETFQLGEWKFQWVTKWGFGSMQKWYQVHRYRNLVSVTEVWWKCHNPCKENCTWFRK